MKSLQGLLFIAFLSVGNAALAASYPSHKGSSPWSFDVLGKPSDVYVVNDADGATIDRYMFRTQGSITIDVPIRRYVGPTDGNGYLQNVSELIDKGIVASKFKLVMPAFDVDQGVFPVYDCDGDNILDQLRDEVNEVYFNDEKVGTLKGQNQVWFQQSFTLPVAKLKFPSSPGSTATNKIRIDIDVANKDVVLSSGAVGCSTWATAIDWAGIKYEAASPVVLVHGIRSSGAVWGNFRAGLDAARVQSDASINLADPPAPSPLPLSCTPDPYNETITFNVAQLRQLVPEIAKKYGTSSLHFVTHSKGGLDSRGFLSSAVGSAYEIEVGRMSGQPVKADLEARSLVTLNTPHLGSVLAKYGVEARKLTALQAARTPDPVLVAGVKGLEGAYYCDLTPGRASAFVAGTMLPNVTATASVATDADNSNDGTIAGAEGEGFYSDYIANKLYRLLATTADVSITVTPSGAWYKPDTVTVAAVPTGAALPNDIIVTVDSAALYALYGVDNQNHLNVHATPVAQTIVNDAQSGSGLVNWRLK